MYGWFSYVDDTFKKIKTKYKKNKNSKNLLCETNKS